MHHQMLKSSLSAFPRQARRTIQRHLQTLSQQQHGQTATPANAHNCCSSNAPTSGESHHHGPLSVYSSSTSVGLVAVRHHSTQIRHASTTAGALQHSQLLANSSQKLPIQSCFICEHYLNVEWSDGAVSQYPFIFLRENCKCPECFNGESQQRIIDTCSEIPLHIRVENVTVGASTVEDDAEDIPDRLTEAENEQVVLNFSDGHHTEIPVDWLFDRRCTTEENKVSKMRDVSSHSPVMWDCDLDIPEHSFKDVMSDDLLRYKCILDFQSHGIALLKGAEHQTGELEKLRDVMFGGFFKDTHYGDKFQVISKPNPNSLAYTTKRILPHVDLPHYLYPPGIQVLHCIEQAEGEGGENIFIDGWNIIQELKQNHSDAYDVLTTTNVRFRDKGSDKYGQFETFFSRPIIGFDVNGEASLDYSNWLRDDFIDLSPSETRAFYKAYYTLSNLINADANTKMTKLEAGDIVLMNNRRLLHGRAGFQENTSRFYDGCYFDYDALYWRSRVLKRRLEESNLI